MSFRLIKLYRFIYSRMERLSRRIVNCNWAHIQKKTAEHQNDFRFLEELKNGSNKFKLFKLLNNRIAEYVADT